MTEVEYWYVEFNERFEDIYEWTRKAVCIARHPSDWIKCKREFDDGVCGVDPYAPVLTGGARPGTHSSGKVEGDLE